MRSSSKLWSQVVLFGPVSLFELRTVPVTYLFSTLATVCVNPFPSSYSLIFINQKSQICSQTLSLLPMLLVVGLKTFEEHPVLFLDWKRQHFCCEEFLLFLPLRLQLVTPHFHQDLMLLKQKEIWIDEILTWNAQPVKKSFNLFGSSLSSSFNCLNYAADLPPIIGSPSSLGNYTITEPETSFIRAESMYVGKFVL